MRVKKICFRSINDSMKHVVHTNEKVDEVIAVIEERQERIENLISHINEISTTIETLQKLESHLIESPTNE